LSSPSGIALDAEGNFFISDFDNRRIRRVGEVIKATIDIDIKPDGTPNSINPTNEGVEPVAILGSETFDVSEVDGMTLIFGKDETAPIHDLGDSAVFADHLEDVNADGFADLVSHYATEESGIAFGDLTACLSGDTFDGAPFMGCDAVRTVPDMDGDGLLDPREKSIGTNAFFKDSDGDGYEDGMEVLTLDSDPLDSLDPASGVTRKGPRRHKRRR
jgi:hypothetical protein